MRIGLLGRKVGMTQIFREDGTAVPVTVIEAGPCTVLQVRTPERDGYNAVQLGFLDKDRRRATRPERGHVAKVHAEPKRFVREIRQDEPVPYEAGEELTVEVFKDVKAVDVTGTSKGRGTAGVMKRHGFHGLPASHGVKRKHRSPGSIGMCTDPGRILKGTRKAGHMGAARCTVRNLKVVDIIPEKNLLLVRGGVPGPNGGFLIIRETNVKR
ncbi:MAG TPA: 50S ribosomal protein L3 [Planctomycetaceae bacterium]|nr:50S ribosomal protein L3 [Planctomycetaceae bacterium]